MAARAKAGERVSTPFLGDDAALGWVFPDAGDRDLDRGPALRGEAYGVGSTRRFAGGRSSRSRCRRRWCSTRDCGTSVPGELVPRCSIVALRDLDGSPRACSWRISSARACAARAFRWLVSVPGQTFLGAGMLAGPWLLLLLPFRLLFEALGLGHRAVGLDRGGGVAPRGVARPRSSRRSRRGDETVRFRLSDRGPEGDATRAPSNAIADASRRRWSGRPLRHRAAHRHPPGPVAERAAPAGARSRSSSSGIPTSIALTGDFLTMESMGIAWRVSSSRWRPSPRSRIAASRSSATTTTRRRSRWSRAMEKLGIRLLIDARSVLRDAGRPRPGRRRGLRARRPSRTHLGASPRAVIHAARDTCA